MSKSEFSFFIWSTRGLAVIGIVAAVICLKHIHYIKIGYLIFDAVIILTPYLFLLFINETRDSTFKHPSIELLVTLVTVSLGIYAMIDITFLHPDPLGGVAILVVGCIQIGCFAIARNLLKK